MHITKSLKRPRFPASIISHAVWLYHRFNSSYRDVQEQMAYRGVILSHETVRFWCNKFVVYFQSVIRKRERRPTDKWHLDEMNIKIKGEVFILWRAVDSEGHELEGHRQVNSDLAKNKHCVNEAMGLVERKFYANLVFYG